MDGPYTAADVFDIEQPYGQSLFDVTLHNLILKAQISYSAIILRTFHCNNKESRTRGSASK